MIEIFKTNVQTTTQSKQLLRVVKQICPGALINFDLEDCDKILRVDGIEKLQTRIVKLDLNRLGFTCEILD